VLRALPQLAPPPPPPPPRCNRYGVGVSCNATRAAEYFASAAELGDVIAVREKAIYFSSGHGGHPISEALAVLYMSLASNAGDPIARSILGSRHLLGHSVPRCCRYIPPNCNNQNP
jgi:hypothetical protein